jgi:hypothetical protein
VYSPSYSLPQQTAANYGLELADGVDPLQLWAYTRFMEQAGGIPMPGYSVTLPPFAKGEPKTDNAAYRPDPALLGLLNVRYVVAEYDLPVQGLELRARFADTRVYENLLGLPRAWIQPFDAAPGENARPVELSAWKPNLSRLVADGPGLLVLSEVTYPGWRAWVDGHEVPLELTAGLLRSVRLDAGKHHVVVAYQPRSLAAGLGLWVVGVVIVLRRLREKWVG